MTATEATPVETVPSVPVADDDAGTYVTRLIAEAPPLTPDQEALIGDVLGPALRDRRSA